jgi:carboxylesterase type B
VLVSLCLTPSPPRPRSIGDFFTWGPVVTDPTYFREAKLRSVILSNVTVRQPLVALQELRRLDIPVILGTTSDEGIVFVYSAFGGRMNKMVYQVVVFSFFRTSAPEVLAMYAPLAKRIEKSPDPDFRIVLAQIIGDYLFRCPNQLFASLLSDRGAEVYLYEFALPTRTPGFQCCDGFSCHTAELPCKDFTVWLLAPSCVSHLRPEWPSNILHL